MDYNPEKILRNSDFLSAEDLDLLEAQRPDGISSAEIVDVFEKKGIRFSEATFRKYIQQGLLPRSRRVGQKGKHKGSRGIYPVGTVRQINEIKRMMSLNYTIEEIQLQFAFVGGELEELRRLIDKIIEKLEMNLGASEKGLTATAIGRRIEEAKRSAETMFAQLDSAAMQIRDNAQVARNAV